MFSERLLRALEEGQDIDEAVQVEVAPMRQAINALLNADPFCPFRISMTSGSVREIRHPKQVVLGASTASIREPSSADPATWRETAVLALLHVVSLEPLFPDEPCIARPAE